MGVLSSSVSITQYRVEGTIEDSFLETVTEMSDLTAKKSVPRLVCACRCVAVTRCLEHYV